MRLCMCLTVCLIARTAGNGRADESRDAPLPVPLTRPELKQSLEDLKGRKPRIPVPDLSEADKEKLGERGSSYEGRLRYFYMPPGEARGGGFFGREPDPNMSLTYAFKTEMFWIVSRANNCHY
jgi:hypothetical protein